MRGRGVAILLLAAFGLSAPPVPADETAPKPLSIADFARPAQVGAASISPGGHYLAKLTPGSGNNRLEILRLDTLELSAAYRMRDGEFITSFDWADDDHIVWTTGWRAGAFDVIYDGGKLLMGRAAKPSLRILGDDEYFIRRLPDRPGYILVGSLGWISRENIDNLGEKNVADILYPDSKLLFDWAGNVRMSIAMDGTDVVIDWRRDGKWVETRRTRSTQDFVSPISFAADQQHFYTRSNAGESTTGIYLNDTLSTDIQLLFHDPKVDISHVLTMPGSEDVGGVLTEPDYPEYHFFDEESPLAKLYGELRGDFPKCRVRIVSGSDDARQAIIAVGSDIRPVEYYLFNLDTHTLRPLLKSRPWIDPAQMSEMTPFSLKARDGVELHGYLTLPKGKANHQLPLVVLPHGGPHGIRDDWGFDEEVQLLAYHGYAVLQLNFRGSGGYGNRFEQLGYGRWGTTMQDDLTDATHWAVEQGVADPDRICIYGASYGGYAALMGAIREPRLYRCAVGYAGPYDLTVQRKKSDTAETADGRAYFDAVLGADPTELKARSPVFNVDRIEVPLLLVHGGQDRRVPIKNFQELTAALDKAGKHYETLVKNEEGHGFFGEANIVEFYTRLIDFLDRNIGERRTPAQQPVAAAAPPG